MVSSEDILEIWKRACEHDKYLEWHSVMKMLLVLQTTWRMDGDLVDIVDTLLDVVRGRIRIMMEDALREQIDTPPVF